MQGQVPDEKTSTIRWTECPTGALVGVVSPQPNSVTEFWYSCSLPLSPVTILQSCRKIPTGCCNLNCKYHCCLYQVLVRWQASSWMSRFCCKYWRLISFFSCHFLCAGGTSFRKQMAAPTIPVNRLHPIDPKDDGNTNFDVVFFHGLQITTKDNLLWPQEWLPKNLKYIRVFSLSYDTGYKMVW